MRTHTNVALMPSRRLKKQYDNTGAWGGTTKAIGINNPNTLNGNLPNVQNATGMTGNDGIVSFVVDAAAQQVYSIFYWHAQLNRINPAKGWIQAGETAAIGTKACDPDALSSFACPENVPFFIQAATTPVTEAWVTNQEHGANPNTDKAP